MLDVIKCIDFASFGDKSISLCLAGNLMFYLFYLFVVFMPLWAFLFLWPTKNKIARKVIFAYILLVVYGMFVFSAIEFIIFIYRHGFYEVYNRFIMITSGIFHDIVDLISTIYSFFIHAAHGFFSSSSEHIYKVITLTIILVWFTLVSGWMLFRFRIKARWAYGIMEVIFGATTIVYSFLQILYSADVRGYWLVPLLNSALANEAFTWKVAVQFVGGAYIVIRGLDNIDKYIDETQKTLNMKELKNYTNFGKIYSMENKILHQICCNRTEFVTYYINQ